MGPMESHRPLDMEEGRGVSERLSRRRRKREDSKHEEQLALKIGRWSQAKECDGLLDTMNDPEVTTSKETGT